MNSNLLTTGKVNLFAPDFLSEADRAKDEDDQIRDEGVRHGLEVLSLTSSFQGTYDIIVRGTKEAIDEWRNTVGWSDADGFPFEVKSDGTYDLIA